MNRTKKRLHLHVLVDPDLLREIHRMMEREQRSMRVIVARLLAKGMAAESEANPSGPT